MGKIAPPAEVRIVGPDEEPVPPQVVGEVRMHLPGHQREYFADPGATAETWRDGWLVTGDLGRLDEDGYLYIVGRSKDVIIRGGENIYCAELERVFQEFPGVLEVAAFGAPDERWGERAVLAVAPLPGRTLNADEILAFGRPRLAPYKIPSEILFTETPFARSAIGKLLRTAQLLRCSKLFPAGFRCG